MSVNIRLKVRGFSKIVLALCCTAVFITACNTKTSTSKDLVSNVEAFNTKVVNAKPGDEIVLANGVWTDAELIFEAHGTKENPITLTVEDKGKVILEGHSYLKIAGEHLIIKGLVFKNGFTPTSSVIEFKKDDQTLANHVRLTECVIDNYSNPERHEQDYWIALYGKNNRVDHNHFAGKRNLGVTMAVRLTTEASLENNHLIDHNYFGPRPNLGANGGETLRIGTSHHSLKDSKTTVAYNYFDRCNGEHEIISNKSGSNTYKYNTFYECTGTLTMRHGSKTLVEGNVFLGNNKPSTGGIRIINGQQTVINNYAEGLTGYRFRGAFVIMNGVPNSPINRYHQVEDAVVKNNTFVNCDHIQLCAGSDAERSATPINSIMEDNIFYHATRDSLFTIYDDISGITFKNNSISPNIVTGITSGFNPVDFTLEEDDRGYLIPVSETLQQKVTIADDIATKDNTGASWYSKADTDVLLNSGKTIQVKAGMNTLFDAVKQAEAGDVIELTTTDQPYVETKTIALDKPISFVSKSDKKPEVLFEKKSLFEIKNGGSLRLEGIQFDGKKAPDYSGNALIATSKYSMNNNYKLFINNCEVINLDVNHSYDVLKVYKNTFADTISVTNSSFKNISGHIMALDKETDNIGIYNAEYVILKNNSFSDVEGAVLRLHRGGKDESTFGPFLEMEHNVFHNIGFGKRNAYNAAVSLYGAQEIDITNNIFDHTKAIDMHLVVGEPIVNVVRNNFYQADDMRVTGDQKYTVKDNLNVNPEFVNTDAFKLPKASPLKGKATDGKDLGVLHN
ncbi:chondroitinase-B domain-containing protein [Formosa sp. A9]|uniref:chondroitinase-B domain-containing protein n=1 Tax=Formosa sp. A9 TaxID=3442641 RepID=UPI003EBDC3A1